VPDPDPAPEDVRLDRDIARGQLALIGVEQLEILLQHEDVLGPVPK